MEAWFLISEEVEVMEEARAEVHAVGGGCDGGGDDGVVVMTRSAWRNALRRKAAKRVRSTLLPPPQLALEDRAESNSKGNSKSKGKSTSTAKKGKGKHPRGSAGAFPAVTVRGWRRLPLSPMPVLPEEID